MIVDHAIKHKTPVFVMGNVEELEKLWETLPKQMFTDIFIRPINVVEMVENIKRQMDEYYKIKKRKEEKNKQENRFSTKMVTF